jgi:hypothetical protein
LARRQTYFRTGDTLKLPRNVVHAAQLAAVLANAPANFGQEVENAEDLGVAHCAAAEVAAGRLAATAADQASEAIGATKHVQGRPLIDKMACFTCTTGARS